MTCLSQSAVKSGARPASEVQVNFRNVATDFIAATVLGWHWFLGNCPTFIMVGTFVLVCFQLRYYYMLNFSKRQDRRSSDKVS